MGERVRKNLCAKNGSTVVVSVKFCTSGLYETSLDSHVFNCDSDSTRQRWLEATSSHLSSNNPEEKLYEEWDCPQVLAVHAYTAHQPDEFSLQIGDVVKVLKKTADDGKITTFQHAIEKLNSMVFFCGMGPLEHKVADFKFCRWIQRWPETSANSDGKTWIFSVGWYHGEKIGDGIVGWFPGNYTTEIASQHARAKNLKLRHRLLTLSANYLQNKHLKTF